MRLLDIFLFNQLTLDFFTKAAIALHTPSTFQAALGCQR